MIALNNRITETEERDAEIVRLETELAYERWARPVDRWMVRLAIFALGWILGASFVSWPF